MGIATLLIGVLPSATGRSAAAPIPTHAAAGRSGIGSAASGDLISVLLSMEWGCTASWLLKAGRRWVSPWLILSTLAIQGSTKFAGPASTRWDGISRLFGVVLMCGLYVRPASRQVHRGAWRRSSSSPSQVITKQPRRC